MNNYFKASGANQPAIVLAVVVLAGAALSAWLGYDTGSRSLYWLAGGLAILAFLIPQAIMVADQWERAVVLRLRKLTALPGPPMVATLPFIPRLASRPHPPPPTTEINAEKALSKDTVPVNIDAIVFWQIHDPERAALEITNYRQAITQVAQTSLREMARRCCRRCCPNASRAISRCAKKSDARLRNGACRCSRSRSAISECRLHCR